MQPTIEDITRIYYIYKKFWYRIESNEPVTEFHIDWDEGEDNSPEKANLEYVEPDKSGIVVITSHIYTKHGSFWPLIKAESIEEAFTRKDFEKLEADIEVY